MNRKSLLLAALALAAGAGAAFAEPLPGRPVPSMMTAAFGTGPAATAPAAFDLLPQPDGSFRLAPAAARRGDLAVGGTPVIVNQGDGTFRTTYLR